MSNFENLSTQIISKLATSGEKEALSAFKKAIVNHELMLLTHYFKEKGILDFYNGKVKTKKTYYWELICIVVGLLFITSGIMEEVHHQYIVSYNTKGIMVFHNGGMTCLYGLAFLVSGFASIYGKKKSLLK